MKDKRTAKEIAANERFIKALASRGFVRCARHITIIPPDSDSPANERSWTLCLADNVEGVVIGWYRTRDLARKQAKLLRNALKTG